MIAILTDFGTRDPFVGVLRGVIARFAPAMSVVDLTNEIPPQDIRRAAYVLGDAYRHFPRGTVFLCVVDPGVGSSRRPICLSAGGYMFVGPDNGIFTVPINEQCYEAHLIDGRDFTLKVQGPTFHGRDIFAPVAAWLSRGAPINATGPMISDPVKLDLPVPVRDGETTVGEVIHIDRFGNAITNFRAADIADKSVVMLGADAIKLVGHYAEINSGETGALINSEGRLEVFVSMGDAARAMKVNIADRVLLL